jgi:quercetin dioxygenase-like cupin family protein
MICLLHCHAQQSHGEQRRAEDPESRHGESELPPFKETPAHSSYDWHPDPEPQFVITLSGTLEFATPDGETFVLRPGDVLVAADHVGKGHRWRLIDDPWSARSCS